MGEEFESAERGKFFEFTVDSRVRRKMMKSLLGNLTGSCLQLEQSFPTTGIQNGKPLGKPVLGASFLATT